MKTTLLLILSLTFAFGQYPSGKIDMHGGKKDPLTSGNRGFSQMNSKSSSLLIDKKTIKKNKLEDKVKKEAKDKKIEK